MFTGIIEAIGTVRRLEPRGGDLRLTVATGKLDLRDVKLGDSIATNGVCLTVVEQGSDYYVADVSGETVRRSTLASFRVGQRVNLEKALTPTTRLGGHLVSGHVDGIGEVISMQPDARSIRYRVKAPDELAKYIAEKGSITTDGISLTVNAIDGAIFDLNIVPHTVGETNIADWAPGVRLNLEVDILARYLERLLLGDRAAQSQAASAGGITLSFLAENGYGHG
ncbi:MAG: riboflavin synthase [Pseudomonadota bacterium]|jgi:riboflavin synthase|uniref:riboflavin synthase n=1 Tax=Perlucidibaca aquatica TaxID=1852776 RepID=UPI00083B1E43|nr:riboflavin synthase [Perlucidibaca aquatica]